MTPEKQYTIDGEPVSWTELIELADRYGGFEDRAFKTTSEAAKILREQGHEVGYNRTESANS